MQRTTTQVPPTHEEPGLPGSEKKLQPRPDYMPRFPGSGRLDGKVAIVTLSVVYSTACLRILRKLGAVCIGYPCCLGV